MSRPRRSRITKDSVELVASNAALHRLAFKAGAFRINAEVYPILRHLIRDLLENIVRLSVEYTDYERKKIISTEHVQHAIHFLGKTFYAHEGKMKTCPVSTKKKIITKLVEYQNQSDCLNLAKGPVVTLIREIVQDYRTDCKWSENALINVQIALEDMLHKIIVVAMKIVVNGDRKTLDVSSLKLAIDILKTTCRGEKYNNIL
jgi:histone H3/H4